MHNSLFLIADICITLLLGTHNSSLNTYAHKCKNNTLPPLLTCICIKIENEKTLELCPVQVIYKEKSSNEILLCQIFFQEIIS